MFLLLILSYEVGIFDSSLRIIAHYYSYLGYIPYKEFGVVYPPGYFILLGKIIPFTTIFIKGAFNVVLISLSVFLIIYGLKRIKLSKSVHLYDSVLLLSISAIIFVFNYNDVVSILYPLITTIWLINYVLKGGNFSLIIIFLANFFGVWLRWDWPIILTLNHILIFSSLTVYFIFRKSSSLSNSHVILYFTAVKYLILGTSLGILSLLYYLHGIGSLRSGYDFIVIIPTIIIAPFRNLPFPPFKLRPLLYLLPYLTIIFLLSINITIVRQVLYKYARLNPKFLLCSLILFFTPFTLLPYALGRSDVNHFMPLWLTTIHVWILYTIIFKKKRNLSFTIFLLLIPFITIYKNNIRILTPKVNRLESHLISTIHDCASKVSDIEASSIFIGRISYDQYLYNDVILYFTRRDLKPGTAYISDEPGLQNSCEYGSEIANQLSRSQKPLLTFLAINPQESEDNLSKSMKSCHKVEDFLYNSKFDNIGYCNVENKEYEIRLYH